MLDLPELEVPFKKMILPLPKVFCFIRFDSLPGTAFTPSRLKKAFIP